MKTEKTARVEFCPRHEMETDPNYRARIRADIPAKFRAIGDQGHEWFESPGRTAIKPTPEMTWLWPGRIAAGQLTVIEGAPGAGKSFLVLDLAARVSRGAMFPQVASHDPLPPASDGPGKVLLVTMQDGGDGPRSRLIAMGADPQNICWETLIYRFDANENSLGERVMQFPVDLPMIAQELIDQPSIRLVVIDSLSDFCSARI